VFFLASFEKSIETKIRRLRVIRDVFFFASFEKSIETKIRRLRVITIRRKRRRTR
jgi:hypothetical protein